MSCNVVLVAAKCPMMHGSCTLMPGIVFGIARLWCFPTSEHRFTSVHTITMHHTVYDTRVIIPPPSHVTRNAATCIRGGCITRNALTCQHVMPKRRRRKTVKPHVLVSVKNCSKIMQAKLPQPVLETPEIDYDYGIIRHFI